MEPESPVGDLDGELPRDDQARLVRLNRLYACLPEQRRDGLEQQDLIDPRIAEVVVANDQERQPAIRQHWPERHTFEVVCGYPQRGHVHHQRLLDRAAAAPLQVTPCPRPRRHPRPDSSPSTDDRPPAHGFSDPVLGPPTCRRLPQALVALVTHKTNSSSHMMPSPCCRQCLLVQHSGATPGSAKTWGLCQAAAPARVHRVPPILR